MAVEEVRLPELGEGIEYGDVVSVFVSEGDRVEKEQSLIEVESEKASMEIPSPAAGVVKKVLVKQGDRVNVGQAILTLERAAEEKEGAAPERAPEREASGEERERPPEEEQEEAGEEVRESERPRPRAQSGRDEERREAPPALREPQERSGAEETATPAAPAREVEEARDVVPAGPGVRRLAREIGVDIGDVQGSGRGGRITEEDVKAAAREMLSGMGAGEEQRTKSGQPSTWAFAGEQPPLPDFSRWGKVTREPMGSLRRVATRTTRVSWRLIPHVTQFDHADITELEDQRKGLVRALEREGVKLTVTAIAIKAAAIALRRFPRFNASLDEEREEIILKDYVHIGVAVDSERGLVVPVIRDADAKSLRQVAQEVAELADRVRSRQLKPDETSGGTFSVTNLGGLGTTYFTPIVTWPQVAVLGVGRARVEPVFRQDSFVPRLILPLAVSYDHRLIDGADAARFLRWIAEALEQPLRLLLEA